MKNPILLCLAVLIVAMPPRFASYQIGSATEAAARELVEIMLREGGHEAATELAEMGGEAAVRQLLERATNEGGEKLLDRIVQYGTRYGPSALKAVERAPSRMINALDRVSPDLVAPAIRAAAREPEITARLVAAYGKDALEVAAKHPGVGTKLSEKLGADGIRVGQKLTTDQAIAFARCADDIAALPPVERNQLLDAMKKAPAAVLDYLEQHPKVLLTAGGVAAIVAAKDNLLGNSTPLLNRVTPPGLAERIIVRLTDRFTAAITATLVIICGGTFCYIAIQLRSLWRTKGLRLKRENAQFVASSTGPTHESGRHWPRR